ncbi:unnamed protein product [Rotaria sordida]|uniref:ADP ribosyltransferase domain-containing protein n=1 Tax=Rotaria sordida TaxID=392033 RepID=A0A814IZJ3_9BILA|nr:unnamed protein product [Rotaria sordida]CAF3937212.1 unnamed protein product [Rotaria sordida]
MGAAHTLQFKLGAAGSTHEDNNFETLSLVWLDDSITDTKENLIIQQKLRTVTHHLITFQDVQVMPRIHQHRQVNSIYVYAKDQVQNEEWTKKFPKIKGVHRTLEAILAKIQSDQVNIRFKVDEPLAVSIFTPNSALDKSTTELNSKFIHSEVSIDVLLRMKSNPTDKNDLIDLCKEKYKDNEKELAIVKEFEQNYSPDQALWWYTRDSFLYRLLNKALRVQNTDMIFLFRFFIRDIEQQLEQHKCLTPIRVYRGQLMSNEELKVLKDSIGRFISMNSFLSTSIEREQALRFLNATNISDDSQRVLITIDADPRLDGVKPFANITNYSYFAHEQEVLLMLGSIFQLIDIHYENQVWLMQMRLCDDKNHTWKSVFEQMKNQYGGGDGQTDLLSFGSVLSNMGKYNDAEKYFHRLLNELPHDHNGIADCYHNLGEIALEKGDYDVSLEWYYKSLEIKMRTLTSHHPDIAESHNSIGVVHRKKGDYIRALESYTKALTIFKQVFNEDNTKIAKCYNNMGNIYQLEKKYSDALEYYQKALAIQQRQLCDDHPDLGSSYGNIGNVYQCLGQHDYALNHYKISLKILENSLPPQHPLIAMTLKNMGIVYEDKGKFQQALTHFEKAEAIRRHALPSTHPHIRIIEEDIQRVKAQMNKFS